MERGIRQKKAGELLKVGERQVRRILKRAKEEGVKGILHRGRGKASNHRHSKEFRQRVLERYRKAHQTGSRIILVYEEIPTLVIGMIYVFDLLFDEDESKGLAEFLRSPIFLSRETSLEKAFLTLQERRQSFALVTDARREVVGVVEIEKLAAI